MAEIVGACAVVVAVMIRRKQRWRKRSTWVKSWLQRRSSQGAYHQLLQELRLGDIASYRNFVRMDAESFDELLHLVTPFITHTDTKMRSNSSWRKIVNYSGFWLVVSYYFLATNNNVTHDRQIVQKPVLFVLNITTINWHHCARNLFCNYQGFKEQYEG